MSLWHSAIHDDPIVSEQSEWSTFCSICIDSCSGLFVAACCRFTAETFKDGAEAFDLHLCLEYCSPTHRTNPGLKYVLCGLQVNHWGTHIQYFLSKHRAILPRADASWILILIWVLYRFCLTIHLQFAVIQKEIGHHHYCTTRTKRITKYITIIRKPDGQKLASCLILKPSEDRSAADWAWCS